MLKTFILVALRNFKKNNLTTFINAIGLTLGFSAFMVLSLFVYNELSYDRWHEKSNRTFRFTTIDEALGVSSNMVAITNPRMPQSAEEEIPEVELASRVMFGGEQRLEQGDKGYYTEYSLYVEQDFFDIFDIPVQNREEALKKFNQPHKLIFTNNFAKRVFGSTENAIGEVFTFNDQSWEVVGLMDDVKQNSHLEFDVLMSLFPAQSDSSLAQYINGWGGLGMLGYAVLSERNKEVLVEEKMAEIALANDVNDFWVPQLQPLDEIHLKSSGILFDYYHQHKGDAVYVYALGGVALFILLIATFNFVNLMTAQSTTRAKEVGIRKVVGSTKFQLVMQHMTESVIMATLALILSFGAIYLINETVGFGLDFDFGQMLAFSPWLIIVFFMVPVLVGILAGIYPSFILSSIKSVSILRGRFQTSSKGIWLRKTLVILQFVASVGMICITLLVSRQVDYIKNKDLGFSKDQIININVGGSGRLAERIESYQQELEKNPGVIGTAFSSNMPGRTFGRGGVNVEGGAEEDMYIVSVMSMDEKYLDAMEIKLAEGRNYDASFGSDQQEAIIINKALQESLGWEEAVGQHLVFGNNTTRTVIGVIEDFHFANMRHKIEPLMIYYNPNPSSNLNVKVSSENMKETVAYLESKWIENFPNYPFNYQFFDQEFDEIFAADEFFANLVNVFTWLSIVLSSMGLFGLSFFMVEQRKKEIGVRKVLGSSVKQIVQILMKEFVWLIVLSNIIAWPIAYLFVSRWVSDFQYRIDLFGIDSLSIYLIAGIGALVVAMIAVSYKSIRAAMANPINSLRDE